ncbi:MAG: penicillin acylase family protein [Crocinitomicaceae bacterium]
MKLRSCLIAIIALITLPHYQYAQVNPENIEIVRDEFGVPHIYGKTDKEAAYGLAWAHSEDNFKTIQETFLPAVGMLGLHSGKDGATLDYVVQLLKCREAAENEYDNLSKEVIAVVEGYVEGINAYAAAHPEEVLVKRSFPMTVMDYLTGYNLVIHFFSDTGQTLQALFGNNIEPLKELGDESKKEKAIGSNAFAIRKQKTTDGKTYLNVNTHQPLEGPFSWYEAHINSEEGWNMLGSLFPGAPFPMIGSNENLGWTHTFNYPDLVDIYQLEMHPKKKNTYKLDGEWTDLEVYKAKIKLKVLGIKVGVKKKAYWSAHGPVIKNESGYFAFRSNALENISSIDQWYQMNKSNNWKEFKEALEIEGLPRFNVMYADREDNIYYLSSGKIPQRKDGFDWENVLPGNRSDIITQGYIPIDELPQIFNPKNGYLFNTNNTPFNAAHPEDNLNEADFDKNIGFMERENNRSMRFVELISQYPKLSYEDFKRIKYDTQYPDSLIGLFQLNDVFALNPSDHPALEELITLIQEWDRKATVDNIGAAQWSIYYKALIKKANEYSLYGADKLEDSVVLEVLNITHDHLIEHFGKLDITLGEQQLHVRGEKEVPVPGLVDMIAAMSTEPYKDGTVKAVSGESYIMLARYSENGVELETILPYGESCDPESEYFTDQMECYADHVLKPMTLNKGEIYENATRIYNPTTE